MSDIQNACIGSTLQERRLSCVVRDHQQGFQSASSAEEKMASIEAIASHRSEFTHTQRAWIMQWGIKHLPEIREKFLTYKALLKKEPQREVEVFFSRHKDAFDVNAKLTWLMSSLAASACTTAVVGDENDIHPPYAKLFECPVAHTAQYIRFIGIEPRTHFMAQAPQK